VFFYREERPEIKLALITLMHSAQPIFTSPEKDPGKKSVS
jgi:hypothetical protein